MSMISPAAFSQAIGVSRQAVSKAIKVGRIPVYDETGLQVAASYAGRKFVKSDEAGTSFRLSRARIDDAAIAEISAELGEDIDFAANPGRQASPLPASLAAAKTERETLQVDLLRLRLAKERGELLDRSVQMGAFESAGANVARAVQAMPSWAEEINGVVHAGGIPALAAWLRAKANALCESLADMMSIDDERDTGEESETE